MLRAAAAIVVLSLSSCVNRAERRRGVADVLGEKWQSSQEEGPHHFVGGRHARHAAAESAYLSFLTTLASHAPASVIRCIGGNSAVPDIDRQGKNAIEVACHL